MCPAKLTLPGRANDARFDEKQLCLLDVSRVDATTVKSSASAPLVQQAMISQTRNPSKNLPFRTALRNSILVPYRNRKSSKYLVTSYHTLCAFKGSNLGPFEYQSNALPTELNAHKANYVPHIITQNTIDAKSSNGTPFLQEISRISYRNCTPFATTAQGLAEVPRTPSLHQLSKTRTKRTTFFHSVQGYYQNTVFWATAVLGIRKHPT